MGDQVWTVNAEDVVNLGRFVTERGVQVLNELLP